MQSQHIAQQSHNANQRIYCRQEILCPTTMVVQIGTNVRVIVSWVCSCYHLHTVSYEIWRRENRQITTELREHNQCLYQVAWCCFTKEVQHICVLFCNGHTWQYKGNATSHSWFQSNHSPPNSLQQSFLWTCQFIFTCMYGSLWYRCEWHGSFMSVISANAKNRDQTRTVLHWSSKRCFLSVLQLASQRPWLQEKHVWVENNSLWRGNCDCVMASILLQSQLLLFEREFEEQYLIKILIVAQIKVSLF